MANYNSLVIINGVATRIHTPDNLITGAGLMNEAGNLTITPTGTDVVIAAGKNISGGSGAGSVSFGSMSGTFSTPSGAASFNGSTNTFTNAITSPSLDTSGATTLTLGTANAVAVTIGRTGQLTTVAGNLTVSGNEIVTGTTTLSGDVVGNINFLKETNHTLLVEPSTTTSTAGGNFVFTPGTGSVATGTTAAAAGGTNTSSGGVGGAAAGGSGAAGAGGTQSVTGGTGGAGTATGVAGAGGALSLLGGTAGANGGAGGANGGSVTLDGAAATGAGTAGTVSLGTTNASAISIGRSGITTTVTGGLTQLTGAFSATGNATSSLTTSSGNLNLSGSALLNLQVNGTTVLQGASTSSLVVQNGVTLSTTGTGQINLPQNFQINAVATHFATGGTGQVTAPNLDTLTAGSASNADALHTHAGLGSGPAPQTIVTTLTTTAMTGGTGTAGYLSGNKTLTPTDNLVLASSRFFGFYEGTSGSMVTAGVVTDAKFTTVGGSPSAGAPVYLAASTDEASAVGKLTATAPSVNGTTIAEVGLCLDNSSYAGSKTSIVLIQPKAVIQL